jgi:hypothetical protein
MKAGAADYLLKDHDRNYLKLMPLAVERALRQRRTVNNWREPGTFPAILQRGPHRQGLYRLWRPLSPGQPRAL